MDGKTYAADSNGVYVYDAGNRTWQTLTTEVTAGQYDQLNAANGKLSISANSGNNTLPRYTQMAILSVDSKTTEIVDTTIFGTGGAAYYVINSTGLSYAGVPYFYYSGPIFNNNQDRMTVLCRYEGEGEDAAWIRVKGIRILVGLRKSEPVCNEGPARVNQCLRESGCRCHAARSDLWTQRE